MKIAKLFFVVCILYSLSSCYMESLIKDVAEQPTIVPSEDLEPYSYFGDTSMWELTYLYEAMEAKAEKDMIHFLTYEGYPLWSKSFQKRSSEVNITTIPIMKNDSINGIVRIYVTYEDSIYVDYFSKAEIELAMTVNLSTKKYHAYRGAIQSMILSHLLMDREPDEEYINWLNANQDRVEERVRFYCIPIYDCDIYYSGASGTRYINGEFDKPIYRGVTTDPCPVLYYECFIFWTNRTFPNDWSGDSNTNGSDPENLGNNYGNSGGRITDSPAVFNAKKAFILGWLSYRGINSDYLDEIYECTGILPDPSGGIADVIIDSDCAFGAIISHITGLDQGQDFTLLKNFLLNCGNQSGDCAAYIEVIQELRDDDPAIRWDRSLELYDLLEGNPDALIDCIDPPADIADWNEIAFFVPPQAALDRLDDLGEGWRLQSFLEPTSAPRVNLDYFSVTISDMPINPATGQDWEPEALFQHIRRNIAEFVDPNLGEYQPFSTYDEQIWNSTNPADAVPAVFSINISLLPNVPGDDGSVICGKSISNFWYFSCVKAPMFPIHSDGYHPVSGHRKFGYIIHANGDMEIFTQGADRFFYPFAGGPANPTAPLVGYLAETIAFNAADNYWKSFQDRVNTFVNTTLDGGTANINEPVKVRPVVREYFKNILNSNSEIEIPCGN